MKNAKTLILVGAVVVFLLAVNFNQGFKKSVFRVFDAVFYLPKSAITIFVDKERLLADDASLKEENQVLQAKIFNYERLAALGLTENPYDRFKYETVDVYARYPFNNNDFIVIDHGKDRGFSQAMPVTVGGSILIGKIDKVFDDSSRVKTIFDPDWQFAVRIGGIQNHVQALFVGGNEPMITYIDKRANVNKGDFVYTASADFPIGLKIGEIDEIYESNDHAFREASLKIPFGMDNLEKTEVIRR